MPFPRDIKVKIGRLDDMDGVITFDVDTACANDRGGGAHASTKIRFFALNTARIGTKTNVILVCIRISLSYKRIVMQAIRHAETVEVKSHMSGHMKHESIEVSGARNDVPNIWRVSPNAKQYYYELGSYWLNDTDMAIK
jgi:hypothetical protein